MARRKVKNELAGHSSDLARWAEHCLYRGDRNIIEEEKDSSRDMAVLPEILLKSTDFSQDKRIKRFESRIERSARIQAELFRHWLEKG